MSHDIERIEALFSRAIEFRPEERIAFLVGACGDDLTLLSRVGALLQAHEASEGVLLEEPRTDAVIPIAEKPGDRIGHYKLLQRIGEGGCGIVYMAEQEQPVHRRVALKLIKLGMDTRNVIARFEAERQALALMDHPNIAKVFDAGATETGRPYFVMELVRGVKITDFCEDNNLSTTQRLDLFMQVCRAIQHAHQKGIIHRDIKPSNVLVTVHDGVPVPKVIDFGIAKAIEGRLTDQTLFTSFEQFIGTPAYMSPEQAELKGLDVDTRTDIYSLGVLLYELLTGKTPFDVKELLESGIEEMRRTIREKEPMRPSTRLIMDTHRGRRAAQTSSESKDHEAQAVPGGPGYDRRELINVLRGDLDWIVMKCLEKDRRRRYETANGLATDLQRHLKGEPVVARPPSNLYRFQKLVRRNRMVFAAVAAVVLALVLGMIGSLWEAFRARRAEREQIRLRKEAENARSGESQQRAAAEQHLYEALLGEARAKQLSGLAGHRFESVEAIRKAAAIRRSPDLSDAAVAAFSLPDLREKKQWRFGSHAIAESVCFDRQFELYACRTPSAISIRRVEDDREMVVLPIEGPPEILNRIAPRRFDPRSRYLLATCMTPDGGSQCRIWDIRRNGVLMLDTITGIYANPDFSPDSETFAIPNGDASISIKGIETGNEIKRWSAGVTNNFLRFSPDGRKLAALEIGALGVQIWDVASTNLVATLVAPDKLAAFAWNDNGSLIAAGGEDGGIIIWESQSGQVRARLEGHESPVTALAFSHHGDLLATGSWDTTLRLWDIVKARQLILYRTQDTDVHFSEDDQLLAHAIAGDVVKLLKVAHPAGYRRMGGGQSAPNSWSVEFSPDGRILLAGTTSGLRLWDAKAGTEIGVLRAPNSRSAHFVTNGGLSVVASTRGGIFRWPLQTRHEAGGDFLRAGAPAITMAQQSFDYLALDRSGRTSAVSRELPGDPFVLALDGRTNVVTLQGLPRADYVGIDPLGRWAAVGTWKGNDVNVYAADSGQLLRQLKVKGSAMVLFSPDGKWLAVASPAGIGFWKTGSWEPWERSVAPDQVGQTTPMAFSPDGSLLAAASGNCEVKIFAFPGCEPVATLKAQTGTGAAVSSLCFGPTGTELAAIEWNGQLNVWDLRVIRQELARLRLDWSLPPLTPVPESSSPATTGLVLDAGPFTRAELVQKIPARDSRTSANQVDLSDYFNAPLVGAWYSPASEGNDLSMLSAGLHEFNKVQFDVRGVIQIGALGANDLAYPSHVLGIRIERQCRRLHFLHAAILASSARPGDELGSYIFHYANGRQVEVPIVAGKDMADLKGRPNEIKTSLRIAWSSDEAKGGGATRLFQTTWENPFPDVSIVRLDFVSDKPTPGQPFLVAITAE
jgi:serine/threonine protein kinase/WD40 repeat protein